MKKKQSILKLYFKPVLVGISCFLLLALTIGFLYKRSIRAFYINHNLLKNKAYKKRIDFFNNQVIPHNSIVFVGNSLTEYFDLGIFKNSLVFNRGIAGDQISGLLYRIDEITNRKPAKIFIEIGINDLLAGNGCEKIYKEYSLLIKIIRKKSVESELYLQSILPINVASGFFVDNLENNKMILDLNSMIQLIAKKNKANYLDLHSEFVDSVGFLNKKLATDGIHLNKYGYEVWHKKVKELL